MQFWFGFILGTLLGGIIFFIALALCYAASGKNKC